MPRLTIVSLNELTGHVFVNVGYFFERYFEKKRWSEKAKSIYKLLR